MAHWEHGTLTVDSTSNDLTLHVAGDQRPVAGDATGLRDIMGVLDALSADGWEVLGPPTVMQSSTRMVTSYLLRRQARAEGDPQIY